MFSRVSKYEFVDTINERRPNNFTYEGLHVLFDYFEEYEESTGGEIEFDPIGICCDYTESTVLELIDDYGDYAEAGFNPPETVEEWVEWMESQTQLVGSTESTVIYLQF